jgi:hypothetical protein
MGFSSVSSSLLGQVLWNARKRSYIAVLVSGFLSEHTCKVFAFGAMTLPLPDMLIPPFLALCRLTSIIITPYVIMVSDDVDSAIFRHLFIVGVLHIPDFAAVLPSNDDSDNGNNRGSYAEH